MKSQFNQGQHFIEYTDSMGSTHCFDAARIDRFSAHTTVNGLDGTLIKFKTEGVKTPTADKFIPDAPARVLRVLNGEPSPEDILKYRKQAKATRENQLQGRKAAVEEAMDELGQPDVAVLAHEGQFQQYYEDATRDHRDVEQTLREYIYGGQGLTGISHDKKMMRLWGIWQKEPAQRTFREKIDVFFANHGDEKVTRKLDMLLRIKSEVFAAADILTDAKNLYATVLSEREKLARQRSLKQEHIAIEMELNSGGISQEEENIFRGLERGHIRQNGTKGIRFVASQEQGDQGAYRQEADIRAGYEGQMLVLGSGGDAGNRVVVPMRPRSIRSRRHEL